MNIPINSKCLLYNELSCSKKQVFANSEVDGCHLAALPDVILLIILSYLPQDSLLHLKETCTLFARICEDFTLWRNVELTGRDLSAQDFQTILRLVNSETTSIKIGSCEQRKSSTDITANWLTGIKRKCEKLKCLGLISQHIDGRIISVRHFPTSLTALDLSGTTMEINSTCIPRFFYDIIGLIPNLKILNLARCNWFGINSVQDISRCKHLEELILTDCVLVEYSIVRSTLNVYRGYRQILLGFRSLKTLDIRRYPIEVTNLYPLIGLPSLKNFYFEQYPATPNYGVFIVERLIENLMNTELDRLVFRNFTNFTDELLLVLSAGLPNLKFLDVTGCSISIEGAMEFNKMRPHVTIVDELRPFSF